MNLMRPFSLLLTILTGISPQLGTATPIPEANTINGFSLGLQAWTFRNCDLMTAIDQTAAVGAKLIEVYPGQKFSADRPETKFDPNLPPDLLLQLKARLKERGVHSVNYGVTPIPRDEAQARKIFQLAKELELYAITTESMDAIDTIEKLAREYDIRVGFHNHPKRENYLLWDPNYVLGQLRDRDPRLGLAADTGHWIRSGLSPVDCLRLAAGRLVSVHLKDVDQTAPTAVDVPYGTGVGDIKAVLSELRRQGFKGNISIEYEKPSAKLNQEVTQCVEFVIQFSPGSK